MLGARLGRVDETSRLARPAEMCEKEFGEHTGRGCWVPASGGSTRPPASLGPRRQARHTIPLNDPRAAEREALPPSSLHRAPPPQKRPRKCDLHVEWAVPVRYSRKSSPSQVLVKTIQIDFDYALKV